MFQISKRSKHSKCFECSICLNAPNVLNVSNVPKVPDDPNVLSSTFSKHFWKKKIFFVKPYVNPPPVHCDYFFNTFYQPSKSLLLGMNCVFDRQDFQTFCLK